MKISRLLFFLPVILWCGGCHSESPVNRYTEITIEPQIPDPHARLSRPMANLPIEQQTSDPQTQQMLAESVAQKPLSWQTPQGWSETSGSGMRVATFKSQDEDPVTTTIVSLGGMAGSLQENVMRWMAQIGLNTDEAVLGTFLKNIKVQKTRFGLTYEFVDLVILQKSAAADTPSMKAAVFHLKDATVFVKMTGSLKAVSRHHQALLDLINSLTLNNE